jgi:hypothetical protein
MREYRLFKILLCSLALSSGAHAQSEPTATAAQPTDREPAIRFTRPKVETPLPDGKLARRPAQHCRGVVLEPDGALRFPASCGRGLSND